MQNLPHDILWEQIKKLNRPQINSWCNVNRWINDFCVTNRDSIKVLLLEKEFGISRARTQSVQSAAATYDALVQYEDNRPKFYHTLTFLTSEDMDDDTPIYAVVSGQSRKSAALNMVPFLIKQARIRGLPFPPPGYSRLTVAVCELDPKHFDKPALVDEFMPLERRYQGFWSPFWSMYASMVSIGLQDGKIVENDIDENNIDEGVRPFM